MAATVHGILPSQALLQRSFPGTPRERATPSTTQKARDQLYTLSIPATSCDQRHWSRSTISMYTPKTPCIKIWLGIYSTPCTLIVKENPAIQVSEEWMCLKRHGTTVKRGIRWHVSYHHTSTNMVYLLSTASFLQKRSSICT